MPHLNSAKKCWRHSSNKRTNPNEQTQPIHPTNEHVRHYDRYAVAAEEQRRRRDSTLFLVSISSVGNQRKGDLCTHDATEGAASPTIVAEVISGHTSAHHSHLSMFEEERHWKVCFRGARLHRLAPAANAMAIVELLVACSQLVVSSR